MLPFVRGVDLSGNDFKVSGAAAAASSPRPFRRGPRARFLPPPRAWAADLGGAGPGRTGLSGASIPRREGPRRSGAPGRPAAGEEAGRALGWASGWGAGSPGRSWRRGPGGGLSSAPSCSRPR